MSTRSKLYLYKYLGKEVKITQNKDQIVMTVEYGGSKSNPYDM